MVAALALLLQVSSLASYEPAEVELKGDMLTSAEHDRRSELLEDRLYVLHFKVGRGELLLVGARHVYDPASEETKLIRGLWDKFSPTIAFSEGRNATRANTIDEGVKTHAEGAVTSVRATESGIPLYTWEPPRDSEFAEARRKHGDKATTAFLFLRGYYGSRRTETVSDARAQLLLARRQVEYGLGPVFKSLAEFEAYWKESHSSLGAWRECEEKILWPGEEHTVFNKVANLANAARDRHLVHCALDAAAKGHRVWMTAGRSHVINYEPVFRATAKVVDLSLSTKRPWIQTLP